MTTAIDHSSRGSSPPQAPPLPFLSNMTRPGRNRGARPQDTEYHRALGDDVYHKDVQSTRIFFQNVKGLTYSTSGEDF